MRSVLVIGSGAGGATVARELQGTFQVTVLEAGGEFKPFAMNLKFAERLKRTGLLFNEKEIELIFPAMKIEKTTDRMIHVRGIGTGGTTTLATGNALRMDRDLKSIGVDLDAEFAGLFRELRISTAHQPRWKETTRRLYEICEGMGLRPVPTPKIVDYSRCARCGRCVLGCPTGAKWDSRGFLREAQAKGARLLTGCRVERLVIRDGKASGIEAIIGHRRRLISGDIIVLAAGGLGTPVILQNSGISCESRLFIDPVLCLAAEWKEARLDREIPMPFVVQREHFILSPYFDYLSYFFNRSWKPPRSQIVSLMIKLADTNAGTVSGKTIRKNLTPLDRARLREGFELGTGVLERLGIKKANIFPGTLNAGHPGGMLPLTPADAETLHPARLPANVYVADATLFPCSLGNPPILTIMALAKRVSRSVADQCS